jgi:hypothetical protein
VALSLRSFPFVRALADIVYDGLLRKRRTHRAAHLLSMNSTLGGLTQSDRTMSPGRYLRIALFADFFFFRFSKAHTWASTVLLDELNSGRL